MFDKEDLDDVIGEASYKMDKWMMYDPCEFYEADEDEQIEMVDGCIDDFFDWYIQGLPEDLHDGFRDFVSSNRSKIVEKIVR